MVKLKKETIAITDCKVSYQRGGTGEILLYLHGAGGSANSIPFLEDLAENFDVILPDHPGFGDSEDPEWLDNIHDTAYFYLDFMDALDLNRVHVMGSSLGGWIALEIAIRSIERFATLTLMNSAGLNVPGVKKGDLFMWDASTRICKLVYDQSLADKILGIKTTEKAAAIAIKNEFTTARLGWEPRFFDPNLHKWLHRIDVPTLVVWGENDNLFPVPYGEKLRASIPGARLELIKECGHIPYLEHPEQLKSLISDFLSGAES